MEVEGRGRGGADRGVAERDAVQVHLEDLRLRVAALDGERKQRLCQLALDRGLIAKEADLDQLLRDRRCALHGVTRLDVDDRRASDPGGVDAGLAVEVAVLDGDDRVGQRGPHRGQRFVVVLVAGRMQVGDDRLAVAGVEDRVPRDVVVEARYVGQRRRVSDEPGRRQPGGQQKGEQQPNAQQQSLCRPLAGSGVLARGPGARAGIVGVTEGSYLAHPLRICTLRRMPGSSRRSKRPREPE